MSVLAAVTVEQIFRWANNNQGVLAVVFVLPSVAFFVWSFVKRMRGKVDRRDIAEEFAHAEKLKKEMETRAEWEPVWRSYGEYLIRDVDRKLPQSEENHSDEEARHSIVVLTKIHKEHLEFTAGCNFAKHIKKVGDSWYFAADNDPEAIKVEYVYWINYRDIVCMRWETDDYWEWPQVCCRFETPTKFPFSRMFFGQCITEGMPRPYYREVCLASEVSEPPEWLQEHLPR